MPRIARATQFALSAAGVYLTNDATTRFFDDSDKLMSNRSVEPA
jgi:hypothetical protein